MPVKYTSYLSSIERDLRNSRNKVLAEAGKYVSGKMKEKARGLFRKRSGKLLKGLTYQVSAEGDSVFVGAGAPAYHAHLLELGTVERIGKDGLKQGKITAKPFILPTLQEESNAAMKILSNPWL
jgi:HK97 gp10 family phage protein